VVESQRHVQLIAVGDSAQAIYRWRGAGDFLARLDADHRLALTQSWRFGQVVADEANVWLGVVGATLRVVGNPGRNSTFGPLDTPDAVLCRSNSGTVEQLLGAHDMGVKVHLVGDGREMLGLAEAAGRLQEGKPAGHPELIAFNSWPQVVDYAENDPGGSDLAVVVKMIERYGPGEVIRAINGAVSAGQADLRVSTVHKAKGLEWDRVRIATDFREPLDRRTGEPLPIPREDAMLAYVAVTRAKTVLDNAGLAWVHPHLETLATTGGETVDTEQPTRARPSELPASPPTVIRESARGTDSESATAQVEAALQRSGRSPIPEDYLAGFGLALGCPILVAEEHGTFVIREVSKDGSVVAYRPGGDGGARSFRPEWCVPTMRPGRSGNPVKVRTVPAEARAARAVWRARHSLNSAGVLPDGVAVGGVGL
jgi:hypothetical protein